MSVEAVEAGNTPEAPATGGQTGRADDRLGRIVALLDPGFLAGVSWDADLKMLSIPRDHPSLGYPICNVVGCDAVATRVHGLCVICYQRWTNVAGQMAVEQFCQVAARSKDIVGEVGCVSLSL